MILKTIIMLYLATFSLLFGESKTSEEELSNSAVVFVYHRFGDDRYPSTNIKLEQFAYQLDYLQKNNYNVWPLSKIVNHIKNNKALPNKTVAITIDDAYATVYTNAYPMLKEKNFAFSVFVNTDAIDNNSPNYMSWEQMRVMQKSGAEFANHTSSHDYLKEKSGESDECFKKRITKSIQKAQTRLQEELGAKTNENPKLLAYSFGEYSLQTLEIVKDLDYVGVTQTSGPIDRFTDLLKIKRFPMSELYANPEGFVTKLNTLTFPIASLSPSSPIIKKNNPPELIIEFKEAVKNVRCFSVDAKPIDIEWISQKKLLVQTKELLQKPRARYTCTAPAKDKKWFWYSHLWIVE